MRTGSQPVTSGQKPIRPHNLMVCRDISQPVARPAEKSYFKIIATISTTDIKQFNPVVLADHATAALNPLLITNLCGRYPNRPVLAGRPAERSRIGRFCPPNRSFCPINSPFYPKIMPFYAICRCICRQVYSHSFEATKRFISLLYNRLETFLVWTKCDNLVTISRILK